MKKSVLSFIMTLGLALGFTAYLQGQGIVRNPGTVSLEATNPAAASTGSAVPAAASYSGINVAGDLVGITGIAAGSHQAVAMAIVDASGNHIVSFGGGTQYTEGDTDTTITGTALLFEGAANALVAATGDATNGLDVDVTRVGGTVTIAGAVTNVGTFVVQENGGALTALQLIDNLVLAEDAVHSSGAPGLLALFVRQDSQSDLCADGDYCPPTIDADGNIRVTMAGGSGGTALADDADFADGTTSGTPIGGVAESASPTTVTEGDFGWAAITLNRALKVTLFTAAGVEIPAATSTEAELSEAVTADGVGGYAIGVRRDTLASSANADGENTIMSFTAAGRLYTAATIDAALPAGTNNIGDVDVLSSALPTGASTSANQSTIIGHVDGIETLIGTTNTNTANLAASTQHYRTSAGSTEDEFEVKATAGVLTGGIVTNTAATVSYLKCSNLTAANTTPGTSTVFFGAAIPALSTGAGFTLPIPAGGVTFSTALTCYLVKGAADTDVAEVGANEVKVNLFFR